MISILSGYKKTHVCFTRPHGFTRPHEVLCGHEVRGGDSKCHTDKCSIG